MPGTPPSPARIVVVDDHPIVRKALVDLLSLQPGLSVSGEASGVEEALAMCLADRPDVAVVDLWLGPQSGLDLVVALARDVPTVRSLVLSGADEHLFAERALRAGALGYLMKDARPGDLVDAVRRVAEGRMSVSETIEARFLSSLGRTPAAEPRALPMARLSNRERHVLMLVGQGYGTAQIAQELSLSVKTIESHYAHIKAKLGLRNARELARTAVLWVTGGQV